MDRIAAMTTFVKVVETGSLSAAGRALNLSLPAVSRQIDNLEAHLRSQLLVRTTRRTAPTEGGQTFYEQAKSILGALEDAETALTTKHAVPSGRLTVSTPATFRRRWLAPAIPEFLARFPEVTVDLLLVDRAVNLLDEGIDVAIQAGALGDSNLIARKLAEYHRVICAAPAYLSRRGEPGAPDAHSVPRHRQKAGREPAAPRTARRSCNLYKGPMHTSHLLRRRRRRDIGSEVPAPCSTRGGR